MAAFDLRLSPATGVEVGQLPVADITIASSVPGVGRRRGLSENFLWS